MGAAIDLIPAALCNRLMRTDPGAANGLVAIALCNLLSRTDLGAATALIAVAFFSLLTRTDFGAATGLERCWGAVGAACAALVEVRAGSTDWIDRTLEDDGLKIRAKCSFDRATDAK